MYSTDQLIKIVDEAIRYEEDSQYYAGGFGVVSLKIDVMQDIARHLKVYKALVTKLGEKSGT